MLKLANEILSNHGKLLYLTKFGSVLYGTAIEGKSDSDYKGIFLPSKKSLLIGNPKQHIGFKTGENATRNSAEDIDLDLWSLHHWLKLLESGDTGAIDVLFSYSHKSCLLYLDNPIRYLFEHPLEFINPSNSRAYVGYCIGQAKKYGIKGSRLGVVKRVLEYTEGLYNTHSYFFLSEVCDGILAKFNDDTFCRQEIHNGTQYLRICGRLHQYNIKLGEFVQRLKTEYTTYGERARQAEQNEGVDWKALSHAYRCLVQMKQLLNSGKIEFPLINDRDAILAIKTGSMPWTEVEKIIVKCLEEVDELTKITRFNKSVNHESVENFILKVYGEDK